MSVFSYLFPPLPPKFPHDISVSRLLCQRSQHSQPFRDIILPTNTLTASTKALLKFA